MNKVTVNGFRRVSKQAARNAYDSSRAVYVIPHKFAPIRNDQNGWMYPFVGWKLPERDETFDDFVNGVQWYNCNWETGYYCAYYLRDDDEGGEA